MRGSAEDKVSGKLSIPEERRVHLGREGMRTQGAEFTVGSPEAEGNIQRSVSTNDPV